MTTPIVINLGLPKSGTTTLSRALRRANFKVADWRVRVRQTSDEALQGRLVGDLVYDGYYTTGDPLAHLQGFSAVTEMSAAVPEGNLWPQTDWGIISAMIEHHPEVLFLLSSRPPNKIASSMMRWNTLGKHRLPRLNIPGLPRGFGRTPEQLERWISGHYAFCRHVLAGTGKLLEFDVADPQAAQNIGAFIGRDLPWWGHSNKNRDTSPEETTEQI